MQDLIIDKEFSDLLIPLTEDEREKLQMSLMADGCLDPLKVWDGIIVDGHHRYEICREYGIDFRVQEMEFRDRDEALVWALENQLARRNLNNFQRAEVALRIKGIVAEKAKEKQLSALKKGTEKPVLMKSTKREEPIHTRKEIAKQADVSEDTVRKVEVILEKATPEVITRARTGEISVNRAYIETRAPERDRPPKREKPLQFEGVIKQTARLIEQASNAVESLLEHATLLSDERYHRTFERWEFDLMIEQFLANLDKLQLIRQGDSDGKETARPKQIESKK